MPTKKAAPTCAARPLNRLRDTLRIGLRFGIGRGVACDADQKGRADLGGAAAKPGDTPRVVYRPLAKFFRDRGPQLAAMIAYFALLSFVPLTFLALSLLGFAGRADESSYLVTELKRIFPNTSVSSIVKAVRTVQDNATTLGIIGAVALAWTSISLFSVLESAFNIVYGRPNRPFLRGKALAVVFLVTVLVATFASLLSASFGYGQLRRHAPGVIANTVVAYGVPIVVSSLALFGFLVSSYYLLTN